MSDNTQNKPSSSLPQSETDNTKVNSSSQAVVQIGSNALLPPISRSHSSFFTPGRYQGTNYRVAGGPPPATAGTGTVRLGFATGRFPVRSTSSSFPPQQQVNMMGPAKPRITSQSAEFATRFANRPSTRPKVIGLDSETMIPRGKGSKGASRGIGGFFPPVKLRMAADHSIPHHHNKPSKVKTKNQSHLSHVVS